MTEAASNANWFRLILAQLSLETVIIIIAGGVLTFLILFIFAKRQIMRFAIRSHRGPHAPIGLEANKALRREIIRRIDAIPKITFEPKMLREEDATEASKDSGVQKLCHYFRMKTVDDAKDLEQSILKKKLGTRSSFESLRSLLIATLSLQIDPRLVHQYCDIYEAARFDPKPFKDENYKAFLVLHKQLQQAVSVAQPKSCSRSPIKTLNTPGSKPMKSVKTFSDSEKSEDDDDIKSPDSKGKLEMFSVPYLRKIAKVDKSRWTQAGNTEEEQVLQEVNPQHISISTNGKEESTAV